MRIRLAAMCCLASLVLAGCANAISGAAAPARRFSEPCSLMSAVRLDQAYAVTGITARTAAAQRGPGGATARNSDYQFTGLNVARLQVVEAPSAGRDSFQLYLSEIASRFPLNERVDGIGEGAIVFADIDTGKRGIVASQIKNSKVYLAVLVCAAKPGVDLELLLTELGTEVIKPALANLPTK
jgi:hypothetical protein